MPTDYSNGKIYTIRSHQTDDVYVGSTTQQLSKRLGVHRSDYKRYINGKYHYVTSFEMIKLDDHYIELVERYPCENREELDKREGEITRATPNCVNKNISGRTSKEYYQDNLEKISEYNKKYREENKEKIREKSRKYGGERIPCHHCNSVVRRDKMAGHLRSKKCSSEA